MANARFPARNVEKLSRGQTTAGGTKKYMQGGRQVRGVTGISLWVSDTIEGTRADKVAEVCVYATDWLSVVTKLRARESQP